MYKNLLEKINNYIFINQNIKVYDSNVSENLKNCDILLESHKLNFINKENNTKYVQS